MHKFWRWLRSFFKRPSTREELIRTAAVVEPPPSSHALDLITVKRRATLKHASFRRNVLEELKIYMRYIKRMKKHDKDAYDLYSKLGAHMAPPDFKAEALELNSWFRETLPAFGAVCFCHPDAEEAEKIGDRLYPKFIYFMKLAKAPHHVQQMNRGAVYCMTAFFADVNNDSFAVPLDVFVVVDGGDVRPLLSVVSTTQTIRHKRGDRGSSHITSSRWGMPPGIVDWAREHGQTPVELVRTLFFTTASFFTQAANTTIRVEARENDIAAVFVVDVLHTPQFFSDRDKVETSAGRTAPIFHIVRPHMRTLPNGKKIPIKAHFSGLSDFKWNGYQIKITVPGKDHASLPDFTAGAWDEETALGAKITDAVPLSEAAERLQSTIKRKRRAT